MSLLLFKDGGGGGVTPITSSDPLVILLTNGKLAIKVGPKLYQPL